MWAQPAPWAHQNDSIRMKECFWVWICWDHLVCAARQQNLLTLCIVSIWTMSKGKAIYQTGAIILLPLKRKNESRWKKAESIEASCGTKTGTKYQYFVLSIYRTIWQQYMRCNSWWHENWERRILGLNWPWDARLCDSAQKLIFCHVLEKNITLFQYAFKLRYPIACRCGFELPIRPANLTAKIYSRESRESGRESEEASEEVSREEDRTKIWIPLST